MRIVARVLVGSGGDDPVEAAQDLRVVGLQIGVEHETIWEEPACGQNRLVPQLIPFNSAPYLGTPPALDKNRLCQEIFRSP